MIWVPFCINGLYGGDLNDDGAIDQDELLQGQTVSNDPINIIGVDRCKPSERECLYFWKMQLGKLDPRVEAPKEGEAEFQLSQVEAVTQVDRWKFSHRDV